MDVRSSAVELSAESILRKLKVLAKFSPNGMEPLGEEDAGGANNGLASAPAAEASSCCFPSAANEALLPSPPAVGVFSASSCDESHSALPDHSRRDWNEKVTVSWHDQGRLRDKNPKIYNVPICYIFRIGAWKENNVFLGFNLKTVRQFQEKLDPTSNHAYE
jgi:hypothetical protein